MLLGRDFVGRVAAVGDDVDYIDVGMYVAGTLAPRAPGQPGTFTDLVAVPAGWLAPVPDGVDVAQAAGVGLAAVTALDGGQCAGRRQIWEPGHPGSRKRGGGFAVQLAKARGAVVAAVTPPAQAELARGLGADVVIPEGADATQTIQSVRDFFGGGVDTAIHVAGEPFRGRRPWCAPAGSSLPSPTTSTPLSAQTPSMFATVVVPSGHKLADLLFKVAAHRLHSHVGRAFSFDQVGDAVNPADNGRTGRTVLIR